MKFERLSREEASSVSFFQYFGFKKCKKMGSSQRLLLAEARLTC